MASTSVPSTPGTHCAAGAATPNPDGLDGPAPAGMTRIARLLMGISIGRRREGGAQDDAEVQPQRPVVDVVEVMLDALAHFFGVGFPAKAVHLRPSGDAG